MFAGVKAELASQIVAIRELLKTVEEREKSMPGDIVAKVIKGLFFVYAYAMYENVLIRSFGLIVGDINAQNLTHANLRPSLLPLALDAEFQAVSERSQTKTWKRRAALVSKSACADVVRIDESVFPRDGSHYRTKQLDTIWEILGLAANPTAEARHRGRIDELVENRNAVAHGRELAENVGGRYSISDLTIRADDYDQITGYLVRSFEILTSTDPRYQK